MAEVKVMAEGLVGAPAHLVYQLIADYRAHHHRFLDELCERTIASENRASPGAPGHESSSVEHATRNRGVAAGEASLTRLAADVLRCGGNATPATSTFFGSNPRSTPTSFTNVRINSPAPRRSTIERAT